MLSGMNETPESGPVATIRKGPVSIPIYWLPSRETYVAKWWEDGKRREKKGKDLDALKRAVRKRATAIGEKAVDFDSLTIAQRAAVQLVIERGITTEDINRLQGVTKVTVADIRGGRTRSATRRRIILHAAPPGAI